MRAVRLLSSSLSSAFLYSLALLAHPTIVRSDPVSQPILHPISTDTLVPGSVFIITWKPDTHFANVTLELWDNTTWGYSRDFGDLCYRWVNPFCGTIVSHAPNTGSFEWHIPKPGSDFPRGIEVFWIKMYVDDYQKPEINNSDPVLSYSQRFAFELTPGQNPSAVSGEVYSPISSPSHSYTETGTYPPMLTESVTRTPSNWKVGATSSKARGSATPRPQENNSTSGAMTESMVDGKSGVIAALSTMFSVLLMLL